MSVDQTTEAVARGVLEEVREDRLVLAIAHTDYRLHLVPTVPAARLQPHLGKRVKGTIHARALRIHPAAGGGRFIEPVWGTPRIVAGKVLSADPGTKEAVIDLTVPFVVRTMEEQVFEGILEPGRLVNFYVETGATFTPVEGMRE